MWPLIDAVLPGLIFCFISVACLPLIAQQFTPPRLQGAGGTGLASFEGYQGAMVNPATLVDGPQVEGGAYYQDISGDGEDQTLSGVGFFDNGPISFFSGSFNYYGLNRRFVSGGRVFSEVFMLSIAERYNEVWAFGVNLNFQRNTILGLSNNEEKNLDVGLMFTPYSELGFGLMVASVLPVDAEEVPDTFQRPNYVALGSTFIYGGYFQVRGDLYRYTRGEAAGTSKYALGLEASGHEFMRWRTGLARDNFSKENSYMLGFGFDGPKLRLDYAYKKSTNDPQSQLHSVDLRLSF